MAWVHICEKCSRLVSTQEGTCPDCDSKNLFFVWISKPIGELIEEYEKKISDKDQTIKRLGLEIKQHTEQKRNLRWENEKLRKESIAFVVVLLLSFLVAIAILTGWTPQFEYY